MTEQAAAITIDQLSYKIGNRYLLENINWQVLPGQRWVVYGANGSGKTTLLSCIAGVQHFDSGELRIFGQPYTTDNYAQQKRKIGFVSGSFFEKHYSRESVLDIVLSGKNNFLGLTPDLTLHDVAYAKELLQAFHLTDKTYRQFHMLSKGERQEVLLARAFMARPQLLLLDEPANGLDVYNRAHLLAVIDHLAQNTDLTIIYVTHYLEDISSSFTNALLLKNGQIFAQGDLESLFSSEQLTSFFDRPVQVQKLPNGKRSLALSVPLPSAAFFKEMLTP